MKVFVMRHGEAEMLAKNDKSRQLTEQGKKQAFNQGLLLKQQVNQFDLILVSPYIRAQQTFEQINLAFDNQLIHRQETWDAITPYGNAELVESYLAIQPKEAKNILLISHLPLVGEIVAKLCGRNSAVFYPATIAEIEWNFNQGQLTQIIKP